MKRVKSLITIKYIDGIKIYDYSNNRKNVFGEYIILPNHSHGIIIIQNIVGVDPCVDPGQNKISNNIHKINCNGRTQSEGPPLRFPTP